MPSLSVHLRQTDDHAGLPFHPSCPVCRRERLAGSLGGDELISRGTQAAIAAGLLAFSAVGAPTAMAQGTDVEIEGTAEVVEGRDADDVDLGEATLPLVDAGPTTPEEGMPVPSTEGEDAAVVVESTGEPAADAAEPASQPQDEVGLSTEAEPIAHAGPAPQPASDPSESPGSDVAEPQPLRADGRAKRERRHDRKPHHDWRASSGVVTRQPQAPAPPPQPAPVTVRVVAGTSADQAAPGDRFHTVQRGESLWSIASDLLGDRASVARVAREVNRLWALNEDRIATGSPDLVYAGTRLRLR